MIRAEISTLDQSSKSAGFDRRIGLAVADDSTELRPFVDFH
jgi:hypothetical protein